MALLGRGAKPWILEASGLHGTRGKLIDCHAAPMSAVSIECSCLISLVETESIALRPHSHGHDAAQRMTKARLGASCHAHEWQLFESVKLPDGKILIPGVLEPKSNFIEPPSGSPSASADTRRSLGARTSRGHRLRLWHVGRAGGRRSRCGVGQIDGLDRRRQARITKILS